MSKDELKAAADEKGLTVTRADGRDDLEPTAADYQAALDHAAAVEAGAVAPAPPQATSKTFEVVGPFPVAGVATGGTFTVTVDPEGRMIDDAGRVVAIESLLVEQGAIRATEEGEDG